MLITLAGGDPRVKGALDALPPPSDPAELLPPPGHFDPMPPAQDDGGLVSPAGRLRVGTWVYLKGERLGHVIGFCLKNPFTGKTERGVFLDRKDRVDYRPEWAVIRNFRVREDGQ